MYCIVLYCIVLYCIVLYCIVLYYICVCTEKRRRGGDRDSEAEMSREVTCVQGHPCIQPTPDVINGRYEDKQSCSINNRRQKY